MDLAELSQRTGIERRQLRYVLDHNLVPGLRITIVGDAVGRPRKFHESVGFGITCATLLRDLGLRHETIRQFLRELIKLKIAGEPALPQILLQNCPAFADLGDGEWVRLRVHAEPPVEVGSIPASKTHSPLVMVTLDIGQIRDQIFHGA